MDADRIAFADHSVGLELNVSEGHEIGGHCGYYRLSTLNALWMGGGGMHNLLCLICDRVTNIVGVVRFNCRLHNTKGFFFGRVVLTHFEQPEFSEKWGIIGLFASRTRNHNIYTPFFGIPIVISDLRFSTTLPLLAGLVGMGSWEERVGGDTTPHVLIRRRR